MRAAPPIPATLLALLWGCGEPSPVSTDVAVYSALLKTGFTDAEAALATCQGLSDPKLAGDCAMVVAVTASSGANQDPARWCSRVPEGTWRDECRFEGAELQKRRNLPDRAAALCLAAGAFADDCGMHMWMSELDQLTWSMGTADLSARLPEANALYQRWAPSLARGTDMEQRFWRQYYQRAFGSRASVDLNVCAGLAEADAARCASAGADLFANQLAPFLQQTGRLAEFCRLQNPSSEIVGPWLGAVPHPALDAALRERAPQLCEAAR